MPKPKLKTGTEDEDIHGIINPDEARVHVEAMEKLMTKIEVEVKESAAPGLLDTILGNLKDVLSDLNSQMQLADIITVSKAIRDNFNTLLPKSDVIDARLLDTILGNLKDVLSDLNPQMQLADIIMMSKAIRDNFNTLLPKSDVIDAILEEKLSSEDIPETSEVLKTAQREEKMSQQDQELVAELFSNLEVAHNHAATACSLLSRLSRTLKPEQLLTIVKASIRPLVQLTTPIALETLCGTKAPQELPDDQPERVKVLLTPDAQATLLQKEKPNSPTRLLAATYAYKILNKFGPGTTQRSLQETYQVKAKQLATCISRHKYLGRTDRKRKSSGSDEGASSSKKPTSSQ